MAITGQALMGHLRTAPPMHAIGGTMTAANESEGWGMASQKIDGRLTGNVVLVCDDTAALADFKRLARAEGHTVVNAKPANTVVITPAGH